MARSSPDVESPSPGRNKMRSTGESGGGAYPNPHSGTSEDTPDGKAAYHEDYAGENGVGYHGGGQAGTRDYALEAEKESGSRHDPDTARTGKDAPRKGGAS